MGRRYRRRKYYGGKGGNPVALLILLAIGFVISNWQVILTIALIVAVGWVGWYIYKKNREEGLETNQNTAEFYTNATASTAQETVRQESTSHVYSSKTSIMTDCEKRYYEVIKEIVEPEYRIQPQINLASIIDKDTQSRYRNELFRNIDFGIFDKNYALLLLIEINDQTHTQKDRIARDSKVKAICEEAGIPLITFWTKYGVNEPYIRNSLQQHLPIIETATDKEKTPPL